VLCKGAKTKGATWNLWLNLIEDAYSNYSNQLGRQHNAAWVYFPSQLVPV